MRAHKRQPLLNDEKRKRCVNGVRVCADNTADWVKYSRPKWIEPNFIIFVTHFRYYLPFEKSHRLKCEFVPNLCSIFDTKQHTHTHEHTHSAFVARSQYISIFIMHHKILLIHFHFRVNAYGPNHFPPVLNRYFTRKIYLCFIFASDTKYEHWTCCLHSIRMILNATPRSTKATAIYLNEPFPMLLWMLLWWDSVNEANVFMLLYQKLFQLPMFFFSLSLSRWWDFHRYFKHAR